MPRRGRVEPENHTGRKGRVTTTVYNGGERKSISESRTRRT